MDFKDINRNPVTKSKYSVSGVPTIMFFKNGEVLERLVGAKSKSELIEIIKNKVE